MVLEVFLGPSSLSLYKDTTQKEIIMKCILCENQLFPALFPKDSFKLSGDQPAFFDMNNLVANRCTLCNEATPKGQEVAELETFDNILIAMSELIESGDCAVDYEYATICNKYAQDMMALIDRTRASIGILRVELEID